MLPENPPRRRCFVLADGGSLAIWAGAAIDAAIARGDQVHVLDCAHSRVRKAGARWHRLRDFLSPTEMDIRSVEEQGPADHADRVRAAVQFLHREHTFTDVHFGVRGGLGFRCLQAKRAGLAFDDSTIVVHLDACSQQLRESDRAWPSNIDDLIIDYMEKQSFETADESVIDSMDAAAFIRNLNWNGAIDRFDSRNCDTHVEPCTGWKPVLPKDGFQPVPPKTEAGDVQSHCDNQDIPGWRRLLAGASFPMNNGNGVYSQPLITIGIAHYNLGAYLPAALASLERQTYRNIEVIVIDDGSTDINSITAMVECEKRFPNFRFLRQANAGIGATRNRCLAEARGEYFVPMDADNLARRDMIERFVAAIERNPDCSAMTCYFLAFADCDSLEPERFCYAGRPIGGPHALSCIRNVYGDANGIFRTAAFRQLGGYETDRGTSCEDWEAYVKLIHAGHRIGVVPDYLFYYRHRDAGFSRSTNWFANHQRVLRQFTHQERLPPGEAAVLWTALLGFQQQALHLAERQNARRYRIADAVHRWAGAPGRWLRRIATPRS